jgi:hypothetical protein
MIYTTTPFVLPTHYRPVAQNSPFSLIRKRKHTQSSSSGRARRNRLNEDHLSPPRRPGKPRGRPGRQRQRRRPHESRLPSLRRTPRPNPQWTAKANRRGRSTASRRATRSPAASSSTSSASARSAPRASSRSASPRASRPARPPTSRVRLPPSPPRRPTLTTPAGSDPGRRRAAVRHRRLPPARHQRHGPVDGRRRRADHERPRGADHERGPVHDQQVQDQDADVVDGAARDRSAAAAQVGGRRGRRRRGAAGVGGCRGGAGAVRGWLLFVTGFGAFREIVGLARLRGCNRSLLVRIVKVVPISEVGLVVTRIVGNAPFVIRLERSPTDA